MTENCLLAMHGEELCTLHCFETAFSSLFQIPVRPMHQHLVSEGHTLSQKSIKLETNIKRREQRHDENNKIELGQESILAGHHALAELSLRSILQTVLSFYLTKKVVNTLNLSRMTQGLK